MFLFSFCRPFRRFQQVVLSLSRFPSSTSPLDAEQEQETHTRAMDNFLRSMQTPSSGLPVPAAVPVTPFYLYLTEAAVLVEDRDHPATLTIFDPADGRNALYMQKSNADPQHSEASLCCCC